MLSKAIAVALAGAVALSPIAAQTEPVRHAVLVHGATMDGSGWRGVHDALIERGFAVSVVQLPLTSLAEDVAATRQAIVRAAGSVVLVGHSYGGAVISVAGTDPNVAALVYVAATQPDAGESVGELNARWPMEGHAVMLDGTRMIVDPPHFQADIAADLSDADAAFLASSQKPTAIEVFSTPLPEVAWRDTPSFGIVATEDRTFDPDMLRHLYERSSTRTIELMASHAVHISRPSDVAEVIIEAAGR